MAAKRDESELREWIIAHLAAVLRIRPESVRTNVSFQRLGLDSVSTVGLTGELELLLGRKLPDSLAYDFPTVDALVGHLTPRLPETKVKLA